MLLHIKTTDLEGNQADTPSIAITGFGKAFLLPIDIFFGWIFTNERGQRLSSRAADIIVIRSIGDEIGSAQSTSVYQEEWTKKIEGCRKDQGD